ncbi:MAG: GntR family transcriptional regulator, partial [Acidimicrobiales bacterium]
MSRIRYHQIAADIRSRITSGELAPGQVLPSEAALGAEHRA